MKIHLIPLGTRFLFKGQIYTKVGPMTAAGESSGVEFIPKHAALQPVPGEAPPPPPPEIHRMWTWANQRWEQYSYSKSWILKIKNERVVWEV